MKKNRQLHPTLRAFVEHVEIPGLRTAKLWIMLVAISLFLTWGGYKLGDRYGLLVGFFSALVLNALVFYYDDWRLVGLFRSRELEGRDPWGLIRMTREMARKLDLLPPTILEIDSATPFMFSAGLTRSRLKIFVSSALIQKLTPREVQALLGYELMRYRTGLTRSTTATAAFADMWLTLMSTIDAAFLLRFIVRRPLPRYCVGPFTWMSLPFVSLFLRLVIRRGAIRDCDEATAESFGDGRALAEALVKLDAYNKTLPLDLTISEAAHFSVNPLARHSWSVWASVQPSIESRVRALTGQYPL